MKKAIISALKIYAIAIFIGVLNKILFLAIYLNDTLKLDISTIWSIFWSGLTLDVSVAGYIVSLPLLLIILGTWGGWCIPQKIWRAVIYSYLLIVSAIYAIICGIDANLYGYWGYRIDSTLIPYLATPTEAAASISTRDVVIGLGVMLIIFTISAILYRWAVKSFQIVKISIAYRVADSVALILAAGVVFVGIRGGVEESVANVSKVYFSPIQYANHAAVNPLFSFISSLGEAKRYDEFYPFYDRKELDVRFKTIRGAAAVAQPSEYDSTVLRTPRPDVAIIICEGLTRALMDMEVEGRAVMPRLQQIASEGLMFDNMYATGSRTDRGVVGVLSGFASQPKISIMKIPAKSRHLPSIAEVLAGESYATKFIYGGDLDFMDMSSYLYATGWQHLLWGDELKSKLRGSVEAAEIQQWGYCDGVMVRTFVDEFTSMCREETPALGSLLTISSHQPFDIPIDMGFEYDRVNSAAYADLALGELIDGLKASEAWDDMVVVIVADHTLKFTDSITYNSPRYHHIPMIWTGGALERIGVESRFLSQVDIAASLLSSMSLGHEEFILSKSVFDLESELPNYGYYTYNDGFGVVDSLGATIYDNTSGMVSRAGVRSGTIEGVVEGDKLDADDERRLEMGKVLLQMTHQWIEDN